MHPPSGYIFQYIFTCLVMYQCTKFNCLTHRRRMQPSSNCSYPRYTFKPRYDRTVGLVTHFLLAFFIQISPTQPNDTSTLRVS
ncbi:hypothetical protein HD554DRAFT_968529 [Boletus coccyginus]|nr:hypothetical protein HD554DRAFT_968529 [Boletus coccyginus]